VSTVRKSTFCPVVNLSVFFSQTVFSERALYVVVRPSVTFVYPTQTIGIFGNVFTPFGTQDIY